MHVAVFDLHASGHHLEYASEFARALEALPDVTVDVVRTDHRPEHDVYFEGVNVVDVTVDPGVEDRDRNAYKRRAVRRAVPVLAAPSYDAVHFAQVDDILQPLCRYATPDLRAQTTVGVINGRYFTSPSLHRVTTAVATTPGLRRAYADLHDRLLARPPRETFPPLVRRLQSLVPARYRGVEKEHVDDTLYDLVRPMALKRCVDDGVLDAVLVHSVPAQTNVTRVLHDVSAPVVRVPDPIQPIELDETRAEARAALGLPADERVLLLFGELRREKGVDLLLDAVERYDGEPFTLVVAGAPTEVSAEAIARAGREATAVTVHDALGFVPEGDVPRYFRAADGVVVPYRRSFGVHRSSNVFQKACAARLPVVAPDFGVFGRQTALWNLGVTFEPGSAESLADALARFARGDLGAWTPDAAARYARGQTFAALAERVQSLYR